MSVRYLKVLLSHLYADHVNPEIPRLDKKYNMQQTLKFHLLKSFQSTIKPLR